MRKYMNNPFGQSRIFRTRIRFAVDPDATNDGTNGTEDVHVNVGGGSSESTNDADENDVSIEALKAELAQAKAEVTRFKNTNDKLLKEKGELTKKAREMMSADQKEKEAQEERDKRFAELEKELRTNKYSKRLVGIGMTEADADAFATMMPELEDADAFFNAFQTFFPNPIKSFVVGFFNLVITCTIYYQILNCFFVRNFIREFVITIS